jgi:hypothetical protein
MRGGSRNRPVFLYIPTHAPDLRPPRSVTLNLLNECQYHAGDRSSINEMAWTYQFFSQKRPVVFQVLSFFFAFASRIRRHCSIRSAMIFSYPRSVGR